MDETASLDVQVVANKQQWKDFLELPERLYRGDSGYVRPLRSMAKLQLDVERQPFYLHASRQVWVCYRAGKPVGRIVAIKDDMHNEYYSDQVGFFGFLELIEDAAVLDTLIEVAAAWLIERGCASMRGPVSPSMKGEFGVLIDGNQYPPFVMMGHSPKFYDRLLTESGFEVAKQFFAFRLQPNDEESVSHIRTDRIAKAEEKILRRYPQLRFRAVDNENYDQSLRDINKLGNVVRRHGWGFVPLTEAELAFMIANLKRVIRFDMIHVAYWEDQLVGFIVNIPDINWVLGKTVGRYDWMRMLQMPFWIKRSPRSRVIALGVHEDFRKKGIAIMLIKRLTDIAHLYDEWEMSWVAEDNLNSIGAIGSVIELDKYKTYRVYEKAINA